jgi:hypothetical protein
MTPFRSPRENSPQEIFNDSHKSLRNVIERCNGVLKGRFRCLLGERYQPNKVVQIINVCCALHNMCIRSNIPDPVLETADLAFVANGYDNENLEIVQELTDVTREGTRIRNILMHNFVNIPQ